MKERILLALKKLKISEYVINISRIKSVQLFFVKKTLDSKSSEDTLSIDVTVFNSFSKNGKDMKGSASVHIYDGMTDAEIDDVLRSAYLAASYVNNPAYELQEKTENTYIEMPSDLNGKRLDECADIMTKALFAEDHNDKVFLNSAELFVYEKDVRILTSNGIDCGYKKRYISGEFVAQCRNPQDVETYASFRYKGLETDSLRNKVKKILDYTLSRAEARIAPKAGNYRVIIGDSFIKSVFDYYIGRANANYIYAGYSSFKLGENVQGKNAEGNPADVTGDRISISLVAGEPFSGEGTPQKDRVLMKEGVLKTYHGGVRFSRYIGVEPTGFYSQIKVDAGSVSLEEMKKKPYLHVVNFSDFQMDDFTGHFGGEIRLAFLYDGEKITPVTGGSINGSLLDAQTNILLSKELQKEEDYEGPAAICFENVAVAGE